MKRNSKKGLLFGTTALAAAIFGVAVIGQSAVNGGLFAYRLSAVNVTGGTITFTGSTVSGTTTTSVARTQTGGTIICKITGNDSSVTSSYVGAVTNGSIIRFYEADGVTEYTFEDVDSYALRKSGTTSRLGFNNCCIGRDGVEHSWAWSDKTDSSRTPSFTSSVDYVSHFWVEVTTKTSPSVALLTEISITYNCVTKQQSGLTIGSAPTKTSYLAGESFDPSGMIVFVDYNNGISVATTAYTVYPSILSISDTYVTISYGGFSDTQAITVSENSYVGTYVYNTGGTSIYTIELYNDLTGLYTYSGSSTYYMHFKYEVDGSSIVFTKDAKTGDSQSTSFSMINLFTSEAGSTYENTNTGSFNDSGNIRVGTCSTTSISSLKTFVKQ